MNCQDIGSEYAVACVEIVVYGLLLIASVVRVFMKGGLKWYAIIIPLTSVCRFVNHLYNVLKIYDTELDNFSRHFLYITPVCNLVLLYCTILMQWT